MLYEYLCSNYKPNEPIFVADVSLPVSNVNLRQMFKILCDSGKIRRFDTGVYYIPKESRLKGGVPLGADTVARYKYISRNGRVDGYYSILLQISWVLLHRCHIWWKLYQIMPVPGYGR